MKVVKRVALFNFLNRHRLTKKRNELCEDAKRFIQVHFVREYGSDRSVYSSLPIREDPDRDACTRWYASHGNPSSFGSAFSCYLRDKNIDAAKLSSDYHIDTRLISKLASEPDYKLSKGDAVALCLGLKLNLSHTRMLLKLAGYTLTNSSQSDLIIRYCIENQCTSFGDVSYIINAICQTSLRDIS